VGFKQPARIAQGRLCVKRGQPGFAQTVKEVLLETGLPAARLELEITESTVMQSADFQSTV
jgi:EAL domain-containing protein (putative c-di-GMP-specific phosphodiesterase class I)